MCGIGGIVNFDGRPVDVERLGRMSRCLEHRGPDDAGRFVRDNVGLVHRRLSIIDVDSSTQPMASADGDLVICFNGEILNYEELRQAIDYPYTSEGDTEVLLANFQEKGPDGIQDLIGQFAFAVVSHHRQAMWLVRDRVGILPLYYARCPEALVFASEIKAVIAGMSRPPCVDMASLEQYLARRSVAAPWTMFEGVSKLPAGAYLKVEFSGQTAAPVRYWSLPEVVERQKGSGLVMECEEQLREAVARNLVADVPVGAYLSGGLDSSLVVSFMRTIRPHGTIESFSASFGDGSEDETPFARKAAAAFGSRLTEVPVTAQDFLERWPVLTWHRDAPISEASDVAVYLLAQAARARGVKVILSGEGSDELFGGYPKHRFANITRRVGCVPSGMRSSLGSWTERRMGPRFWRARTAVRALSEPTIEDRLEGWFAPFTASERAALIAGATSRKRALRHMVEDPLHNMLRYDVEGWLSDNLLERGDRMSMASSVELRPPFLDNVFVEWAWQISSELKVRHGEGKWILREVARNRVPTSIVNRAKSGFRVPVDEWFRGPLGGPMEDALLGDDSFVGNTLDRPFVRGLVERHRAGFGNEGLRLWTLLALEVWHSVFFSDSGGLAEVRYAS